MLTGILILEKREIERNTKSNRWSFYIYINVEIKNGNKFLEIS